jgi:uncharacterized protein YvpB
MQKLLNVKPLSQLSPIPIIMGCEGVCASMILRHNHINISPLKLMRHWPKHDNNPYKGYVGHHFSIKLGRHQTIFPSAIVPYLKNYDADIIDSTGKSLTELTKVIDQGQPVVIYHTVLGQKPVSRVFKFDNIPTKLVSNIHTTVLVGYDETYYYYIDPLWLNVFPKIYLPAIIPTRRQILKIKKDKMETSYNAPGKMSFYLKTTNY